MKCCECDPWLYTFNTCYICHTFALARGLLTLAKFTAPCAVKNVADIDAALLFEMEQNILLID